MQLPFQSRRPRRLFGAGQFQGCQQWWGRQEESIEVGDKGGSETGLEGIFKCNSDIHIDLFAG